MLQREKVAQAHKRRTDQWHSVRPLQLQQGDVNYIGCLTSSSDTNDHNEKILIKFFLTIENPQVCQKPAADGCATIGKPENADVIGKGKWIKNRGTTVGRDRTQND